MSKVVWTEIRKDENLPNPKFDLVNGPANAKEAQTVLKSKKEIKEDTEYMDIETDVRKGAEATGVKPEKVETAEAASDQATATVSKSEDPDVSKQIADLTSVVAELAKSVDALKSNAIEGKIEKSTETPVKKEETVQKEKIEEKLVSVIEGLHERLDIVEKSRGAGSSLGDASDSEDKYPNNEIMPKNH